jgi:glycosyltransferase involved in cell wall biosynthesis
MFRMNITYIENVRIPSERAHAYQITTTCAWMAKLGHHVTLVNPDRTNEDVFAFFNWPKDLFTHVRIPCWDPLTYVPMKLKKIGYALQRASFVRRARRFVTDHHPDAWYTRDLAMIDALIDSTNAPWFLELHDEPTMNIDRWNRVKDHIAGFFVISQGLRSRLIELGIAQDRIMVAPDGFEPREFECLQSKTELRDRYHIPQSAFVVFYSGGFYEWKGLDAIVRLWSKTDANAHLVLLGGPAIERERLERLIDDSARSRVHVIPSLPRASAIVMYPIGDVGLLASSPDQKVGHSYTSPLKLFEYLAGGLPILASDVPSSHDVLTGDVAKFFGKGERSFLSALSTVQFDTKWVKLAHEKVQSFVAPYAWQERTRKILKYIEDHKK